MQSIMVLILSVFFLALSVVMFTKAAGSLNIRRLNMSTHVFYSMLVFAFFGSLQVYYRLEPPGYIAEDEGIRFYGWLGVMYSMLAIPVGMYLANIVWRLKDFGKIVSQYQQTALARQEDTQGAGYKRALYFFSIISIASSVYFLYSQRDDIALLNLIGGSQDYWDLMKTRRASGVISGGWFFINSIALWMGLAQLIAFSSYTYWCVRKDTRSAIWFALMSLCTVAILTYNLTKAPVLTFLSGIVMAHILTFGQIKRKHFFIGSVAGLFLIGILFIFFQGTLQGSAEELTISTVFVQGYEAFMGRTVLGQLISYYLCLEIFPTTLQHIGFASTGRFIHEYLNMPFAADYGIQVMSVFRPEMVEAGVAGHATTLFLGEAWANFGLWGILVSPVWVGFFVQSCHAFMLRVKKTPFAIGVYVQLTVLMPVLTGFVGFYYPAWLLQFALQIIVIIGFSHFSRASSKSKAIA